MEGGCVVAVVVVPCVGDAFGAGADEADEVRLPMMQRHQTAPSSTLLWLAGLTLCTHSSHYYCYQSTTTSVARAPKGKGATSTSHIRVGLLPTLQAASGPSSGYDV